MSDLPDHVSDLAATFTALRRFTDARIGLARSGASLATQPLLDFRLAHARARDAVHAPLDEARLAADLGALGGAVVPARSAAGDPQQYLMRPDLGRRLDPASVADLSGRAGRFDLAIVVADGLSARAVQDHAAPLLSDLLPGLADLTLAPLVLVRHGRVAAGDEVAMALGADSVLILIGERPGLSAPDSLGAYLTFAPTPRTTDADRNCLSNIRPAGLPAADAARRLQHLIRAMRARRLSGVGLKDTSDLPSLEAET